MFTNDFREEGLPCIGTQVLVNDITDKLEKRALSLAPIPYPPNAVTGESQVAILVEKMKKVEGASRRPKWQHRALKVRLPDNSVSLAGHPDHCA